MEFSEVQVITANAYCDNRGYFVEQYQEKRYAEFGAFVQDNLSFSKRGVIRGMHMQKGQNKLISVIQGEIVDVVVDVRQDSETFGGWASYTLSEKNHSQLFVPDGFAHGFQVVSEVAHVLYKVSTFYDPELEKGFRFDDPDVGIAWPLKASQMSDRDKEAPLLRELV